MFASLAMLARSQLSVEGSETPPNHLGLDFHIMYIYVRLTYVSNTRARVSDLR